MDEAGACAFFRRELGVTQDVKGRWRAHWEVETTREREIRAALLLGLRPAEYRLLDLDERVEMEEYLTLLELKARDHQRAENECQERASQNAATKRRIEEQEARMNGDGGPPVFPRGRRGKR